MFFDKDSLENLGHQYQLGHSGGPCPFPLAGPMNFIVFDLSRYHFIAINYCNCIKNSLPTWTQLLREGWFPAMLSGLQTSFTFECLEFFHELTLQGKISLYDLELNGPQKCGSWS